MLCYWSVSVRVHRMSLGIERVRTYDIRLVSLEHGESRGETRTWNLLAPGGALYRSSHRPLHWSVCISFQQGSVLADPPLPPLPSPDSSAGDLHRQGSGLRNALGTAAPAAHEMSLALCVGIPEHATSPGVSLSPAAIHPVSLNPTASPPTPCSVRGLHPTRHRGTETRRSFRPDWRVDRWSICVWIRARTSRHPTSAQTIIIDVACSN